MTVAFPPLLGRCRRCDADFSLLDLTERSDGRCPHCGWILSADHVPLVLEESMRAYRAHQDLTGSLHRLVGIPGNLEVLPHSVFGPLLEEVGWEEELRQEPEVVHDELTYLKAALAHWERFSENERERQRARLSERALLIARRLRRIGAALDARRGNGAAGGDALRDAAGRLEQAGVRFGTDGEARPLLEGVHEVEASTASPLAEATNDGEDHQRAS
jgi:hypothetical protein